MSDESRFLTFNMLCRKTLYKIACGKWSRRLCVKYWCSVFKMLWVCISFSGQPMFQYQFFCDDRRQWLFLKRWYRVICKMCLTLVPQLERGTSVRRFFIIGWLSVFCRTILSPVTAKKTLLFGNDILVYPDTPPNYHSSSYTYSSDFPSNCFPNSYPDCHSSSLPDRLSRCPAGIFMTVILSIAKDLSYKDASLRSAWQWRGRASVVYANTSVKSRRFPDQHGKSSALSVKQSVCPDGTSDC